MRAAVGVALVGVVSGCVPSDAILSTEAGRNEGLLYVQDTSTLVPFDLNGSRYEPISVEVNDSCIAMYYSCPLTPSAGSVAALVPSLAELRVKEAGSPVPRPTSAERIVAGAWSPIELSTQLPELTRNLVVGPAGAERPPRRCSQFSRQDTQRFTAQSEPKIVVISDGSLLVAGVGDGREVVWVSVTDRLRIVTSTTTSEPIRAAALARNRTGFDAWLVSDGLLLASAAMTLSTTTSPGLRLGNGEVAIADADLVYVASEQGVFRSSIDVPGTFVSAEVGTSILEPTLFTDGRRVVAAGQPSMDDLLPAILEGLSVDEFGDEGPQTLVGAAFLSGSGSRDGVFVVDPEQRVRSAANNWQRLGPQAVLSAAGVDERLLGVSAAGSTHAWFEVWPDSADAYCQVDAPELSDCEVVRLHAMTGTRHVILCKTDEETWELMLYDGSIGCSN